MNFLHYNDFHLLLENLKEYDICYKKKNKKRIEYIDMELSFDIETTSTYFNNEKCALMYCFMICIDKYTYLGRTWEQCIDCFKQIQKHFNLDENRRVIVYVHNLSYEFQFMRKYLKWIDIFSLDVRKPIYALCSYGIEFRCSYILSGYSLEKVADNLKEYKINKLVGDLDYYKIRHNNTPLTQREIEYCLHDVEIVVLYIKETKKRCGGLDKIPLTQTGFVRNYARKECFKNKGYWYNIIRNLTLSNEEYILLKQAFQGGFTHGNPYYIGCVMKNVSSYDFTSSYPAVMLSEKFPITKGMKVQIKDNTDFYNKIKRYCCLFECKFEHIESTFLYDNYISISRCKKVIDPIISNGRLVSAKEIVITLTEQDFIIIKNIYKWGNIGIRNFYIYKKGYLPIDLIRSILKLYKDKTILKGVEGKEVEYLHSKEMLNSVYGMCVTDVVRNDNVYENDTWVKKPPKTGIEEYNKNRNRFLYYPWGVWVTAYARKNLWSAILECGKDYIYCDTDSVKILNKEKHIKYFNEYNERIEHKLYDMCGYYNIEKKDIAPYTIKGDRKILGVWDYEGEYKSFKTLGAKRYMTETEKGINITVSGLNKKISVLYILGHNKEPFEFFNDHMYIPKGYTGKKTHTYIDDEKTFLVTDYLGTPKEITAKSGVHLEETDYSLSLSRSFIDYITLIRGKIND